MKYKKLRVGNLEERNKQILSIMRKKIVITIGMISLFLTVISSDNYAKAAKEAELLMIQEELLSEGKKTLIIHTYSGKKYVAKGSISNLIQRNQETIVNLEGTIKEGLTIDSIQNEMKELEEGNVWSIAITTKEMEYSFYSSHPVVLNEKNEIEFYGYFVAYYDKTTGQAYSA